MAGIEEFVDRKEEISSSERKSIPIEVSNPLQRRLFVAFMPVAIREGIEEGRTDIESAYFERFTSKYLVERNAFHDFCADPVNEETVKKLQVLPQNILTTDGEVVIPDEYVEIMAKYLDTHFGPLFKDDAEIREFLGRIMIH